MNNPVIPTTNEASAEPLTDNRETSTGQLLTVNEVAVYLRIKQATVRAMARSGKLEAIKVGRLLRFKKSMIDEYIQGHTIKP